MAASGAGTEATRRQLACWVAHLPRGARVPEDREHAYLAEMRAAHADLQASRLDEARARARGLARAFPGSPGPELILCGAEAQTGKLAAARKRCEAAARADPDATYAQYALGCAASAEGRWKDARARLQRTIELDGAYEDAWARLATVHARLGETSALAALRERYRARFGRELAAATQPAR